MDLQDGETEKTSNPLWIRSLKTMSSSQKRKIYKPKKEEDEDDQPEGLETGGLEEIPDEEESEDEDFEENEK